MEDLKCSCCGIDNGTIIETKSGCFCRFCLKVEESRDWTSNLTVVAIHTIASHRDDTPFTIE